MYGFPFDFFLPCMGIAALLLVPVLLIYLAIQVKKLSNRQAEAFTQLEKKLQRMARQLDHSVSLPPPPSAPDSPNESTTPFESTTATPVRRTGVDATAASVQTTGSVPRELSAASPNAVSAQPVAGGKIGRAHV